jgi:hypothetical protein
LLLHLLGKLKLLDLLALAGDLFFLLADLLFLLPENFGIARGKEKNEAEKKDCKMQIEN